MLDRLLVRRASPDEYGHILSVYEACNYRGGIREGDIGFLASLADEHVGAVRLTSEEDKLLLRGMMVRPEYQRQGIGKKMLRVLDVHIANSLCYLIGREHLASFYGSIGFTIINAREAPPFLVERMTQYNKEWNTCIIMRRTKSQAES